MAAENKKDSSSRGVVLFMVAAVGFAALAGILVSQLLGRTYAEEPLQPVVVAARDIVAGQPLGPGELRVAQWPVSSVPRGAHSTVQQLIQSRAVPLIPVAEGSALLASQLSEPQSGMGVAAKLPGGQRAVAVLTDESVSRARLIYPGARVDVLTTFGRARGGRRAKVKTKVFLQNVLVLAVGPNIDAVSAAGPSTGRSSSAKARLLRTGSKEAEAARRVVTLAVTPEDAERLVLAIREGRIDLVLRSPKDEQTLSTPGATPAMILGTGDDRQRSGASGSRAGGALDEMDAVTP